MVSAIRQGDVFWIDFGPAHGSEPAGRHPCVVVQGDIFNRTRIRTAVVCLITSNLRLADAPGNVALRKGEAKLPKASVVNVSQVVTLDHSELVERTGRVSSGAMKAIIAGLYLLLES